jgi:CRISPR-associated protein (TIGR03986 family)
MERFVDLANERFELQKNQIESGEIKSDFELLPYTPIQNHRSMSAAFKPRLDDLVFFRLNDLGTQVVEIAYSSIWRARVEDSQQNPKRVHDFVKDWSHEMVPAEIGDGRKSLSPTELLFGVVEIGEKGGSKATAAFGFKGKVTISTAFVQSRKESYFDAPTLLRILSAPKLPSPSMYFVDRSTNSAAHLTKPKFLEKVADPQSKIEMRGRKAYLHALRDEKGVVKLNDKGLVSPGGGTEPWRTIHPNEHLKQKVWVEPIQAGNQFVFEIRFDNLSRWELETLCATVVPSKEFEHKVGMGKPIGLGSIKLTPRRMLLVDRHQRYGADDLTDSRYRQGWGDPAQFENSLLSRNMQADLKVTTLAESASPFALAAKRMKTLKDGLPALWASLNLTGNPKAVTKPVIYPVFDGPVVGQSDTANVDRESEGFGWYMANERESNQNKTKVHPGQLGLFSEIAGGATALPSLRRTRSSP